MQQADLSIHENKTTGEIIFEVNKETCSVCQYQFQRCCNELGLKNTQGVLNSFKQICEWFIREGQYVEFEEINQ